jgi:hypothetical protein
MGHLSLNAIWYLLEAVRDVKVVISDEDIQNKPCEVYRLTNAKQIVLRVPIERATTLFIKVHWDLIEMHISYNGNQYISHFLDDYTRINYVYA